MIAERKPEMRGVKRTICVGLGGTGRDVLMQMRRLIVERYGDLNRLPVVRFMHLDTDKAASQSSGLRTGNTYRGVDLSFRDAERVNATMTAKDVTNLVQGLERRQSNRANPYDHIGRWLPPQLIRNIKAIEEGAKGIRPVGRLAFFHNYTKFRAAIDTAERLTRGHEATLLQQQGLRVERGLDIFVIGSLCGGTGSGMFLDVAYSLRKLYGEQGAQIFGYFIISPELYGNTPTQNANTYAALKELDHYTASGSRFEAVYDIQNLVWVREQRPPFDYTYLISHQSEADYAILEQRKLCNVIAHKIALDFVSELAPVVSGMRDNFLNHLIEQDSHRRPNIQRYLTFGLAAIYFPRDRITRMALNRISLQLVQFWLEGEGQTPDPQLLAEQSIVNHNWQNSLEDKKGLIRRLKESVTEAERTFSDSLKVWQRHLNREIEACSNKSDRVTLSQRLSREFRQQFRKVEPGETESTRGIWLTRLKQSQPKLTETLKQDIDRFLAALLMPSNTNFSLRSSRAWLEALITQLDRLQRNLAEEFKQFKQLHTQEDIEKHWQGTEENLQEIEEEFELPFVQRKRSRWQDEAKQGVLKISQMMQNNFNCVAVRATLEIIAALRQHAQNLSNRVTNLSSSIARLRSEYEREQQELKQLNFDEMSGEAIFNEEDVNRCCEVLLPEAEAKASAIALSLQIIEAVTGGDSLATFIDRVTEEELLAEIYKTVDSKFGRHSASHVASVVKRFLQNYSGQERQIRLSQILQEASPLLRLNKSDPYYNDEPQKSARLIGFKDTDEPEVRQFKELLKKDLAISDDRLKPTQTEEEILMVTEYAGFPLRLIDGIEQKQKYYLQATYAGNSVHTDYRATYTDIIPPDVRTMERLEDIFYPCLALKLLEENTETQSLEFEYDDSLRGRRQTAQLSNNWGRAIEQLILDPGMTEILEQMLAAQEQKILAGGRDRWERDYLPELREFINKVEELPETDPNSLYKNIVVGKPATPEITAEEGAIARFRKKIEERLATSSTPKHRADPALIEAEYIDEEPSSEPGSPVDESETGSRIDEGEGLFAKLEKLVQMKEKGHLSEAEYQKAKSKLLGLQ